MNLQDDIVRVKVFKPGKPPFYMTFMSIQSLNEYMKLNNAMYEFDDTVNIKGRVALSEKESKKLFGEI